MEENTNATVDTELDFDLSGMFGDEPSTEEVSDAEVTEQAASEEPATTETAETAPETAAEESATQNQDDGSVIANYMGQDIKVPKEEQLTWIQKGMDRDRVAQQRDDLRNQLAQQQQWRTENEQNLSSLKALADSAFGGDVSKTINAIRVNYKVHQGLSRDAAEQAVKNEDLQRQVDANRQRDAAIAKQKQEQAQTAQRQQADIMAFVKQYPGVDPKSIPQSVWTEVRNGGTLVNAYGHYKAVEDLRKQNEELSAKIAAIERNKSNQDKSIGSVRSAGASEQPDGFLAGFDSAWR